MRLWCRLWLAGGVLVWIASAAPGQAIGGPAVAGELTGELPEPSPGPDVTVISGVPSYIWYHGCGPTSLGMIIGYWDARWMENLIPGSNDWDTNQQAIKDVIASPGHIADYALYEGVDDSDPEQWPYSYPKPDLSELDPAAAHPDDSLADFSKTSWSSIGMKHGWGFFSTQTRGLQYYGLSRGYPAFVRLQYFHAPLWDEFVVEIDAGRPVQFIVDTTGDARTDHFVTVIGYDSTPGDLKYAAYTTWDHDLHWFRYQYLGAGLHWGVHGATFFEPIPEPAVLMPLTLLVVLIRRRRPGRH